MKVFEDDVGDVSLHMHMCPTCEMPYWCPCSSSLGTRECGTCYGERLSKNVGEALERLGGSRRRSSRGR